MKVQNLNSASQNTEHRIKQAFAELVHQKGSMSNITVTELTAYAGITRGTFYTHYNNIAQVGSSFREEILTEFFKDFKTVQTVNDVYDFFDKITIYLKQHEDLYHMLISSRDTHRFMEHLTRKISAELSQALAHNTTSDRTLDIDFFVSGATSLLIKYFQDKNYATLDEINIYLKKTFRRLFLTKLN